ncbi:MAG: alpha/beta hydrolase, partial [Chloroflexota bacterium]
MTNSTNNADHNGPATVGAKGEEMLVDIGGRRLYITCMGDGSPTVILEHGMATESDSWAQVQQAVAKFTRVCAFDRAGRGKSDPAPKPRTSEDMVTDLHTLL